MNQRTRLFVASCLALVVTAMMFIIRGDITDEVVTAFELDYEQYGFVSAMAFFGFAGSILVVSPLLDWLGMRTGLYIACVLHLGGMAAFIVAPNYEVLYMSMFIAGFGNGLVEAVINPLCAAMYPDEKTHKMNVLHAWWPGGLIIGGLLAVAMRWMELNWQIQMGIVLIPTVVYGWMIFGLEFPSTERKAAGIPAKEMWKEALSLPFLLLLFCMMVTASMELAPGQWVNTVLKDTAQMRGTMILVYGSALMFVLRHFAGHLAHAISPIGMMWASVTIAGIGLYMLSAVETAAMAYVAATVFYIGVCYMWPTMLGIAAERFPRGGAITIGWLGFAGQFALGMIIFKMGAVFDDMGGAATFKYVSKLGIIGFVIFGAWWIKDYMSGGYKPINLQKEQGKQEG